jgi:hypothetical protein
MPSEDVEMNDEPEVEEESSHSYHPMKKTALKKE